MRWGRLAVLLAGLAGTFSAMLLVQEAQAATPDNRRILRLLVNGVGEKRSEYSIYVSVAEREVKYIGYKARRLYCFQHSRSDNRNWRFFSACGEITPLYEDTYHVRGFPNNLGKIDEVLSGRTMRYSRAMRLAVSDLKIDPKVSASPLSARGAVQSYLDNSGVFVGMSILPHGSMK